MTGYVHSTVAPRAPSADAWLMDTRPANDDTDDEPGVLISDRALDDLATKIMALEDARAAWEAEQRARSRVA